MDVTILVSVWVSNIFHGYTITNALDSHARAVEAVLLQDFSMNIDTHLVLHAAQNKIPGLLHYSIQTTPDLKLYSFLTILNKLVNTENYPFCKQCMDRAVGFIITSYSHDLFIIITTLTLIIKEFPDHLMTVIYIT